MNEGENICFPSSQGCRFIKNEQGDREQKAIDIPLDPLETKKRGIIIVGHVSRIKDRIIHILETKAVNIGEIIVLQQDPIPANYQQGFDHILEKLQQEKNNSELIFEIREQITGILDFQKERSPDFLKRKSFYQQYSQKVHTKKGSSIRRTKQRKK